MRFIPFRKPGCRRTFPSVAIASRDKLCRRLHYLKRIQRPAIMILKLLCQEIFAGVVLMKESEKQLKEPLTPQRNENRFKRISHLQSQPPRLPEINFNEYVRTIAGY